MAQNDLSIRPHPPIAATRPVFGSASTAGRQLSSTRATRCAGGLALPSDSAPTAPDCTPSAGPGRTFQFGAFDALAGPNDPSQSPERSTLSDPCPRPAWLRCVHSTPKDPTLIWEPAPAGSC